MSGELEPEYIAARTVLLDALEALGEQREAVIVVGAQAVYLHTGTIELAVAEFTTDADIAFDPELLRAKPEIHSAMTMAGFKAGNRIGAWVKWRDIPGVASKVEVDLMVPEAVVGAGRRAARLKGSCEERSTEGARA
jgi:hypothetical protein